MPMWKIAIIVYFIIGSCIVTFSRALREIKESINDIDRNSVPRWKIVTYYILVYCGFVCLWPIFLKSWFEKPKTALDKLNENQDFKDLQELFKGLRSLCDDGVDADELPDGYGEFGLERTNPVPCNTIMGSEVYLAGLRTENGDEITYERIGSFSSKLSSEPIDGYQIYNQNGDELSVIYISPYQKRNSNKAPPGFCLLS